MQELKSRYTIEISYQPINKMWGASIKKGNLIANEADGNLLVAIDKIAQTILLTESINEQ